MTREARHWSGERIYNVKPHSAELIVDEMLAICSDIDRWREKKASEEAKSHFLSF